MTVSEVLEALSDFKPDEQVRIVPMGYGISVYHPTDGVALSCIRTGFPDRYDEPCYVAFVFDEEDLKDFTP